MDRIVNYAQANNLKVRGFPLVAGANDEGILSGWSNTPAWVYNGNYSREEMIKIMYDHITTVINRYRQWVKEWIVVNESASGDISGGFVNNIWKVRLGEDYVKLAFQKAKELAPDAVLIWNDWGGDYLGEYFHREDGIYNHVKNLLQDGAPIDAVGLQFHLQVPTKPEPTVDSILANFERYHKLGLKVYVTEVDVSIIEPVTPEKLAAQKRVYSTIMEAVLQSDICNSICLWDFTDLYSWIPRTFPGFTDACLFDKYIKPKPAYDSVMDVLKKYVPKSPATQPPVTVTTSPPTAPFPEVLSMLAQYGTVEPEVIYGTAGGVELKMDIWQPKQSSSAKPAIVYVHGNDYFTPHSHNFIFGDKSEIAILPIAAHWLGRGYLVASVNYRLAPEYIFPAQVEDVKCAVRFLRENAAKYGLNPDKIGACGVGAGGYLVSMLGLCDTNAGFDNSGGCLNQSSKVQAVADLYGISDIVFQYQQSKSEGPNGPISKFIGGSSKLYEIASKASPINYVSSSAPPFLIMHGDKDVDVPPQQSETLYNKLLAAKIPATLVWVKNAGNGFVPVGKEPVSPTMLEQNTIIADFFDKYLK
jgi:endo-1,4-beta-xylanase